jgi:phage virion morphogenesis protein
MVSLRIDIKGDKDLLAGLMERLQDFSPVTKDMGERMRFSIEENFRTGGRPVPWRPLAKATVKARARMGKGATPILILHSFLKNTIAYRAGADNVIIGAGGPSTPYARIQQLGGKAGRGKKVTIPARSYLVIQESDLAYLRKSLTGFLVS